MQSCTWAPAKGVFDEDKNTFGIFHLTFFFYLVAIFRIAAVEFKIKTLKLGKGHHQANRQNPIYDISSMLVGNKCSRSRGCIYIYEGNQIVYVCMHSADYIWLSQQTKCHGNHICFL